MTYLAVAALLFLLWFVLVVLFTPGIDYRVRGALRLDSPEFTHTLHASCQSALHHGNRVTILDGGARFYPEMLEAIRAARRSVNLECYIFQPGRMAEAFIEALAERARAGVVVSLVLDALGSLRMRGAPLARLEAAGCRVGWYRPLRWYSLHRINNRTHRELLVVDGRLAFVGGAGVADWWIDPDGGDPPWRDLMVRVEGPVVGALQGVFAENWLECGGEILTGDEFFPLDDVQPAGGAWPALTHGRPIGNAAAGPPADPAATMFVLKSSPADRATVNRVAFQLLIDSARERIELATPYFLPDKALRRTFAGAAARGVRVTVLVPGPRTDQRWVRLASRRLYGTLLEAGIRIYEYQPGMIHRKMIGVDGLWSLVGTTNMDNRSFEHNDEVNLGMRGPEIARELSRIFTADLAGAREITLDGWRRRPLLEKIAGPFIWLLERQQ